MKNFTDEKTLLREIKNGNGEAFEFLFNSYYPRLRGYAARFVTDEEAVRDIIQESFLRFWEKRDLIEAVSISSLLFAMVRNACLNYLKHARIEQEYMSFLKERETTTFFFNQIVEQELLTLLSEAIQDLPEQTGQVFQLVMEGFDNAEIAEKLNLSIDSVKSHKKRGKQLLKSRLGDITVILLFLSNC